MMVKSDRNTYAQWTEKLYITCAFCWFSLLIIMQLQPYVLHWSRCHSKTRTGKVAQQNRVSTNFCFGRITQIEFAASHFTQRNIVGLSTIKMSTNHRPQTEWESPDNFTRPTKVILGHKSTYAANCPLNTSLDTQTITHLADTNHLTVTLTFASSSLFCLNVARCNTKSQEHKYDILRQPF
jgi:hypothetical protein